MHGLTSAQAHLQSPSCLDPIDKGLHTAPSETRLQQLTKRLSIPFRLGSELQWPRMMITIYTVLRVFVILTLPLRTLEVDIEIQWWSGGMAYFEGLVTARWNNVSPGDCCKPTPSMIPSTDRFRAGETTFHGLRHQQFGAGWAATGFDHSDILNCTGAPIMRVFGPSTREDDRIVVYNPPWAEDEPGYPHNVVFAAAWIDLRTRFPPNSAATRYLQWQGVKGLVWGSGTWSAASDGIPFPRKKRNRRGRKVNGLVEQGTVYIREPMHSVYPDVYRVNGIEYLKRVNETYVSDSGKMLNFSSIVS